MFNAPRPSQRYVASSANGFGSGSFVADNPLSGSTYDGLDDPWSAAPSPTPTPAPASAPSTFTSVIGDAIVPPVYQKALSAVDPSNSGETSVNALSRVLGTSSLSASTIERIVNLVSSRPRVSKLEFFVALALVALAQTGKDLSVEQVASLASQNNLPVPSLDLDSLPPTTSTLPPPIAPSPYHRDTDPSMPIRSPAPPYSSDDPWSTARNAGIGGGSSLNGAPSSVSGTGLPRDWWKRQERVNVSILGQQGFILARYTVYEITSDRGTPVSRRYSEFDYLWDCLVRRYPFRILPHLPPKRIGADESFLEQRRRGLMRFLNFVVNHPVIKDDGLLAAFLSEPSLENWRKHTPISLEEESASKRVDRVEEMSIPSDLEEKLDVVRRKIGTLIEQWQKICILAERIVKRREAAAVRNPHALFKRSFLSHLAPSLSIPPSRSPSNPVTSSSAPSIASSSATLVPGSPLASSIFGSLPTSPLFGSTRPDGVDDGGFYTPRWTDPQADLSRLNMTLNALNEANEVCWRGECELCSGVRQGLGHVSSHIQREADSLEQRARMTSLGLLEALKSQRDLYIAMRDLFIRHDRLSGDQVERLKKRVEANSMKLEGIRTAQKEGWQVELEKVTVMIERDQATIAAQLNRRVFTRYCMWHELRVVLHNRENALVTQAVRDFAREESAFSEEVAGHWVTLAEAVETMPFE